MTSPWVRRIAIALGVLVLLFVAAGAVLVATFDANRYKALAVDWMRAEHQRTLAIDGPIELSVFPRLAVKVSKLRLSEHARQDEFLAVEQASLAVRVLPLLRRQLVVDRVSARGVRAAYLRDARGARNIDDLLSAGPAAPAPASSGSALRYDISGVQLDDVQLRVRDETSRLAGEVALQSFSSGRLARGVASPVSLRARVQLSQPATARLGIEGRAQLALDPDKGGAALHGLELQVEGEAAGVKALKLALEGAMAWDGQALSAAALKLALKSAELGSLALAPSTVELKRALFNPSGQRLEIEALRLALAGRQAGAPFELALDWPQLAVDARQLQGSALSGRVKTSGTTALAGSFRSAAPSGSFDAIRLPGLELTLQGSAGARKINASAIANLLLQTGRGAASVEQLQLQARLADPGVQPLVLKLQGSAGGDARAAQWRTSGSLNGEGFESSGQAAFSGPVPMLKASARFDSLDLNRLLPPESAAAPPSPGASPGASAGGGGAEKPLPLDLLKAVDGQFAFEAGTLTVRQYKLASAKLAASLDHGRLLVSNLSGRAWGGSFAGQGSADADARRVALKLDARGVNVHALLKDVAGKDLLEGTGQVVADLDSTGATLSALRSNLAGSASVRLRDGAIKGINLARSLRQAKAALSLKQDALSQASATEKTDFSELNASARIANGVAQSDDLELKSPFLRIGGSGRFDIGRGRIDYTARASVVATSAGQGSPELDALRGITVPVRLTGPFDAIEWKIQWSDVAAAAVESRLKEKLGEAIGKKLGRPAAPGEAGSAPASPKDVLKDRLRGLFK